MARPSNFGVRGVGRPKATAASKMGGDLRTPFRSAAPVGASPSDGFAPGIPAAAFKRGGKVSYHDDPRMTTKSWPRGGGKR